jgi:hypothetical protein
MRLRLYYPTFSPHSVQNFLPVTSAPQYEHLAPPEAGSAGCSDVAEGLTAIPPIMFNPEKAPIVKLFMACILVLTATSVFSYSLFDAISLRSSNVLSGSVNILSFFLPNLT